MKIKKLEFETSKGSFVVVDTHGRDNYYETLRSIMPNEEYIGLLKELTEEQASEIVGDKYNPRNYGQYNPTAIYRLHSLIKSNCWYLENPVSIIDGTDKNANITWLKAESRTLNNPVIFKIK